MKKILLILGVLVVVSLFMTGCIPPAPAEEPVVFDDEDADETDDVDEETEEDDEDEVEETEEDTTVEDDDIKVIVSEEGSVSQDNLDDLKANLDSMDIEDLGGLSE